MSEGTLDHVYIYGSEDDDLLRNISENTTIIFGLGGDDDIVTFGGRNHVFSGDGNDFIFDTEGVDRIFGDAGNDVIMPLYGIKSLDNFSGDRLRDSSDISVTMSNHSEWGVNTLDGGYGHDTLHYGFYDFSLHIDLDRSNIIDYVVSIHKEEQIVFNRLPASQHNPNGYEQIDFISGFENIISGSGDDYIEGSNVENHIAGSEGDDKIFGFLGNDFLYGNEGNDIIYGGADNDHIWGNEDNDYLVGGEGLDHLYGGEGNDVIYGNDGNDSLAGYNGDDVLFGGAGNDMLYGQEGSDTYYSGLGKDYMFSGGSDGAKDKFIFRTAEESVMGSGDDFDRIVGFETGLDEINLARLNIQAATVTSSDLGANVYHVSITDNADFGIVVTTTGGILSASDIIV